MVQVGRRYLITREANDDIRKFKAVVDWVEDRGDYWYIGYTPDDNRVCMWGVLKVKKIGKYKSVNYSFGEVL